MKINNILKNISEKWYKETKSTNRNEYREIFVNPSKKELLEIVKDARYEYIRFIADSKKREIYVAFYDVFHYTIAEEIGMEEPDFVYKTFSGIGFVDSSGVDITQVTDYLYNSTAHLERYVELGEEILNGDYDWMKRYNFNFTNTFLSDLENEIEMAREELEYQ